MDEASSNGSDRQPLRGQGACVLELVRRPRGNDFRAGAAMPHETNRRMIRDSIFVLYHPLDSRYLGAYGRMLFLAAVSILIARELVAAMTIYLAVVVLLAATVNILALAPLLPVLVFDFLAGESPTAIGVVVAFVALALLCLAPQVLGLRVDAFQR